MEPVSKENRLKREHPHSTQTQIRHICSLSSITSKLTICVESEGDQPQIQFLNAKPLPSTEYSPARVSTFLHAPQRPFLLAYSPLYSFDSRCFVATTHSQRNLHQPLCFLFFQGVPCTIMALQHLVYFLRLTLLPSPTLTHIFPSFNMVVPIIHCFIQIKRFDYIYPSQTYWRFPEPTNLQKKQ